MLLFWVVKTCGLVGKNKSFEEGYCLHIQPLSLGYKISVNLISSSMEWSPSWDANSRSASQNFPCFMETEWSFLCFEEPSTRPYPNLNESSTQFHSLFLYLYIDIILPFTPRCYSATNINVLSQRNKQPGLQKINTAKPRILILSYLLLNNNSRYAVKFLSVMRCHLCC